MIKAGKFFLFLIITLINFPVHAQTLTGSWEGRMGSEILQINIEQKNGALCGYTHDYEINDRASFCSAKFNATYLFEERKWLLQGYQFITHAPSHVFMNIKIWFDPSDPPGVLRASVNPANVGLYWHDYYADAVLLRKKSNKPVPYPGQTSSCFDKTPDKPNPERDNITVIPKKPVSPATPTTPVKKDTVKIIIPKKLEPVDSGLSKVKDMEARKKSEQSNLVIHSKNINLKLYDNGIVDGDTISVFYNGKLLVRNQRLSEKAIELNITLDDNAKTHEITLFAENLGDIPPNTALIVVTAGKQRFELRSKASLEENAVLVFKYEPN